jgi:23S rRNA-/tRNA-specific pseudouridylate synthase
VTWDPAAPPLRYDVSTTRPTLLGKYRGAWVIDKPSGWLVHPASNDPAPVLDEWIQGELRPNGTVSPIHRLDKETSGLVLVSDRGDVRGELGQIFAGHDIDKTYIALVHGRCHRKGIIRRTIQDGARMVKATTRYRLLRWIGPYSLIVARPEEGRKHQIRRHFSAIGHPLLGDARYGELRPWLGDEPGRLALHAFRLVFADGTVLEAPMAPELTVLLGRLTARYGSAG